MNILIITAQGVQDEEFIYPYYRFLEDGHKVFVATPGGKDCTGKFGVPVRASYAAENLQDFPHKIGCVFLPGGFEGPDRVRKIPSVKAAVSKAMHANILVAAICHGPWVLISAGVCKGYAMTCYESIVDDVRNAGAIVVTDKPVVIDRNLITAPHYRENGPFMREVCSYLERNKVAISPIKLT